ncbi:zinc finger BED domain-containing protein RICESLEEPER 2-like [Rhizophagus clarus]|uniref:Zinc finger BED domain-containing protein RICESLEEPER 2-like n=1 Tax=Rhizophagus clarus TaxID=94130 RepID=A0A8H3QE52_9GLOM|nr:zinc finger BED domain-containing protein RICESLEEPER 2-like [Rhizophagus clarus]
MSDYEFYYDEYQESEYNEEENETTDNERNKPFQEPPQEPSQEPPQEHSQEEDNLKKAKTYSDTWQYFNTWDPQHPTKVVCKKCNHTYSKSTGISTLKEHLKKVHGIVIDKIKKTQTKLNFPRVDPWPKKDMLVRDQALVEWITETMIILEPLERATVYLSAAQYPTIADIRFVFLGILEHLESIIGDNDFEQKELASSVNQKIGEYWNIINQQTLVSTVLDPRYKLSLFEVGASAAEAVSAVTSLLANYHHVTIPENRDVDETSSVSSVSNVSDELDRYLALQVDENVKPLLW